MQDNTNEGNLNVEIADNTSSRWKKKWQNFVEYNPCAEIHHSVEWYDILNEVFEVRTFYLQAYKEGELEGIFPLYYTDSILLKAHLTSMYGGCLSTSRSATICLTKKAIQICNQFNANFLLLRGGSHNLSEVEKRNGKIKYVLDMTVGIDAIRSSLNKKTRWAVKQAEKKGYGAEFVKVEEAVIGRFWDIYSENMRRLGTPVMSIDLFYAMSCSFKEKIRFMSLYKGNNLVGGMLCLTMHKKIYNMYAAVLPEHQKMNANYLLYSSAIYESYKSGFRKFDFGYSTEDSGASRFKQKWRGETFSLDMVYKMEKSLPDKHTNDAGKFALIWSKTPLVVCNWLGPIIRKKIPFG